MREDRGPGGRPAVFIDRDGTLIEETGYLSRLDRLVVFPYAVDAVRLLNRGGFAVVIITNQAGLAKGLFEEAFLTEVHGVIEERLRAGGALVDGFFYCPHHPQGIVEHLRVECDCRKPRPGLITRAARELNLDLARSFVVGDRVKDVQAGQAVGARTLLVRTGGGAEESTWAANTADATVDTLIAAAAWILQRA
ncbi:MAG: D-glycero-alpha-D-manno-heptose-1,7-bisphosphate 7-phosphatase [Vicinamibacterales bacterium]